MRKDVIYRPATTATYPATQNAYAWEGTPTRVKPTVDYIVPGDIPKAQEANYVWGTVGDTDQNNLDLAGQLAVGNFTLSGGVAANIVSRAAYDYKNSQWTFVTDLSGTAAFANTIEGASAVGPTDTNNPSTTWVFAANRNGTTVAVEQDSHTTTMAGKSWWRANGVWVANTTAPSGITKSIYYSNRTDLFICVSAKISSGQNWISTTRDGLTWTDRTPATPLFISSALLYETGYFAESPSRILFFQPDVGTTLALGSTDGFTWKTFASPATSAEAVRGLEYDSVKNRFVLLLVDMTTKIGRILISDDGGVTWVYPKYIETGGDPVGIPLPVLHTPNAGYPTGLAVQGSTYAIVTTNTSITNMARIMYSVDGGITWRVSPGFGGIGTLGGTDYELRIACNDNQFIVWYQVISGASGSTYSLLYAGTIDGDGPITN